MPERRTLPASAIEATAVFLFLLQALRALLSSLFGLIYDVVFAETMGMAELGVVVSGVLAALLAPLFVPQQGKRRGLLVTALLAALARPILTINQPACRLWSALVITAAASTYGAILLRRRPRTSATALTLAFVGDQLLRAAGDTYDLSLQAWWLPVQTLLSLALCAVAWLRFSRSRLEAEPADGNGIGIASGLSLGALLFLETSLLGFPNTLARWTGADYTLVAPLLMAATLLPLLRAAHWGGFALFALTLLSGWVTGHRFYQLAILAPMLLAQLSFVSSIRTLAQPSDARRSRLPIVLGMAFFLLLNVALAFAFTYPYTIYFFRDKGDYVFLLAILILLLPSLKARPSDPQPSDRSVEALRWGAAVLVAVLTIIFVLPPQKPQRPVHADSFRVATYNIHYGYDGNWRFSLEEQARTIEQSGADIVMLQEVDAGRITSYGVDDALWLGRRLGMEHVFGPALEDLSGVALLSRFPITERETAQLTSQLEQTAIVHAQVRMDNPSSNAGDAPPATPVLDAYGTWLGLEPEERARQLQDALTIIGSATPAVLGGDFNAEPDSPTYRALQAASFVDPFTAAGLEEAPTAPATNPKERIDFVWARGLDVRGAQVLDSRASDHRLVVVELARP